MRLQTTMTLIASLFLTVSCVHGQVSPASDIGNVEGWVYQAHLSDEFNTESFDRDVWYNLGEDGNYRGQWKGRAPSQYNPDNIRVNDGNLYLTSRWQPDFDFADEGPRGNATSDIGYGEVAPVTTAALLSKSTFKYGYMEMRAKKADGPISSSYWTTGPGGETDAFESFGRNPNNRWSDRRVHTSLHDWRKGSETFGKRIWDISHILDFRVADDFNIYGFEWDPNYLAIYVNGGLIKCMSREDLGERWVATAAHKVWIDSEIFDWEVRPENLKPDDFGPDGIDFVVDYARVYQRENETVERTCETRTNLIDNGDFEQGLEGWDIDGHVTTESFKGQKSLELSGKQRLEKVVKVKPNTLYLLSAAVTSDDTNMKDKWMNAYLGVLEKGQKKNDIRFFFPHWKESSLQFRTGPDTNEVRIYFTNAPQGGRVRLDELLLTELETHIPK